MIFKGLKDAGLTLVALSHEPMMRNQCQHLLLSLIIGVPVTTIPIPSLPPPLKSLSKFQ